MRNVKIIRAFSSGWCVGTVLTSIFLQRPTTPFDAFMAVAFIIALLFSWNEA